MKLMEELRGQLNLFEASADRVGKHGPGSANTGGPTQTRGSENKNARVRKQKRAGQKTKRAGQPTQTRESENNRWPIRVGLANRPGIRFPIRVGQANRPGIRFPIRVGQANRSRIRFPIRVGQANRFGRPEFQGFLPVFFGIVLSFQIYNFAA